MPFKAPYDVIAACVEDFRLFYKSTGDTFVSDGTTNTSGFVTGWWFAMSRVDQQVPTWFSRYKLAGEVNRVLRHDATAA